MEQLQFYASYLIEHYTSRRREKKSLVLSACKWAIVSQGIICQIELFFICGRDHRRIGPKMDVRFRGHIRPRSLFLDHILTPLNPASIITILPFLQVTAKPPLEKVSLVIDYPTDSVLSNTSIIAELIPIQDG